MNKKHGLSIAMSLMLLSIPLTLGLGSTTEENAALASDARTAGPPTVDRSPEMRASRSDTNMFVSQVEAPSTTTTTSTPTTVPPTTTTTTVKRQRVTTALKVADDALPAPDGGNTDVVSIALAQVGKRYVSGAEGPNAFDCSGLVYYVFNRAGISIPRLSSDGYFARYQHITRGELQQGDLVVYPGHIAIYVGDGQIVSASTPRGGVKHYGMMNPGTPKGYVRIT